MESEQTKEKYIIHVCHPLGKEIFFGISQYDNPEWLIGYGGGNMYVE